MRHEGSFMQTIKIVGKSGQISLGKALAGAEFIMEEQPGGDIVLKRAVVIPVDERWAHEPAIQEKLARADAWLRKNRPAATDLSALEDELTKAAVDA
jgi:hypothetical protein